MVESITTSSCRIYFKFKNVQCIISIFGHSYSEVLSCRYSHFKMIFWWEGGGGSSFS